LKRNDLRRILVTGVGGAAGICVIKALKPRYFIIGVDCNPLSTGFTYGFSDEHFIVPHALSPDYIEELIKLRDFRQIDLIFPTVDEELYVLSFAGLSKTVCSSFPVIERCLDKYLCCQFLESKGIPVPRFDYTPFKGSFEKPRFGRGGKKYCNEVFHQEFLKGDEYSVDCLSDLDGKCLIAVPRKCFERKGGVMWKGKIEDNAEITDLAKRTVETLGIIGPSCIQILDGKIIDVNPRVGGTTSLTVYAGVNIPFLTVKLFLHQDFKLPKSFREVSLTRYFKDVYWE